MNRKILMIILCVVLCGTFAIGCGKNTIDEDTDTTYDENGAFLLRIEDVFTITGRGITVTGKVERGTVKVNDEVQIIGLDKEIITTTVVGIESFSNVSNQATVGDNVGIILKDIERDDVQRGQVIAKPNSIVAVKKFEAEVSVISTEDGGRETPFVDGFSPKFCFLTDISGTINLPKDKDEVKPGENGVVTITLEQSVAIEVGTEFTVIEDGKMIASGKVTKIN